jgi:hypothetical protein
MCHYGSSFWVVSSPNLSVSACTETLRLCDNDGEIVLESFIGRRALIGIAARLQ